MVKLYQLKGRDSQSGFLKNNNTTQAVYKKFTSNSTNDIGTLKEIGWRKLCHANINKKKKNWLYKVDCRTKKITKDKEVHHKMIKGSIHQKDT